jgi:hypothetical protein
VRPEARKARTAKANASSAPGAVPAADRPADYAGTSRLPTRPGCSVRRGSARNRWVLGADDDRINIVVR